MRNPPWFGLLALATSCGAIAATPDYSLTIYSSAQPGQISTDRLSAYGASLPGYALVRDGRSMTLQSGNGELRFTDVAKRIDPTTVSFESLTDPGQQCAITPDRGYWSWAVYSQTISRTAEGHHRGGVSRKQGN